MMPINLLVANRGEIAIRIMRAAAELGIRTLAIFSEDDATSLHTRKADERASAARRRAPPPISTSIKSSRSRRPRVAMRSIRATAFSVKMRSSPTDAPRKVSGSSGRGRKFSKLFGDKVQARLLAERAGVPVLPGTAGPTGLDEAPRFSGRLGPRRCDDDQGGRRRRRPRHAPRHPARRSRGGLRALRVGGPQRLRQRRPFRRATDSARAPYRGADYRRQRRRREPSGRARMHHPAPQPEADRGRAESRPAARSARSPDRGRRAPGRRRSTTTISAPSNFSSMRAMQSARRPSPSSRPIRACRSSTPSPKKLPASIWSSSNSSWPPAIRSRNSASCRTTCRTRAASRSSCASTWNRWARMASPSPPAAPSPHSRCPRAPAFAPTPSATPATRPVRASIRCWPSSSRIRRPANLPTLSQRPTAALCEFRIEGVPTNIGFLQSLLAASRLRRERSLYAVHRRPHRRTRRRGQFRSSAALLRVRRHQWRRQHRDPQPAQPRQGCDGAQNRHAAIRSRCSITARAAPAMRPPPQMPPAAAAPSAIRHRRSGRHRRHHRADAGDDHLDRRARRRRRSSRRASFSSWKR